MLTRISKEETDQTTHLTGFTPPEYIRSCYTCGGCNTVCPVHTATGKLRPMKLVYMAKMGLSDQLLSMPDIWYCLECRRCTNLCPMMIQSTKLFQNLRAEAVVRETVGPNVPEQQKKISKDLIFALWHAARSLLDGKYPDVSENWEQWAATPPVRSAQPIKFPTDTSEKTAFQNILKEFGVHSTSLASCFTCRECSSSCPICTDTSVFDPLMIVRSANFGLKDELLRNPSIWLCLECRSCLAACSQGVKPALIIRRLQHLACEEGAVPEGFLPKWIQLKNEIYMHYIDKIDTLLFQNGTIRFEQGRYGLN